MNYCNFFSRIFQEIAENDCKYQHLHVPIAVDVPVYFVGRKICAVFINSISNHVEYCDNQCWKTFVQEATKVYYIINMEVEIL